MRSLSREEQKQARWIVAALLTLRYQNKSEEEISKRLRFNSSEELYTYLKDREVPDWIVYPHGKEPSTERSPREKLEAERKAQPSTAPTKMLPAPKEAEELFQVMETTIRRYIERVASVEESLKGARFEAWWTHPPSGEKAALGGSEYPHDPLWRLIAIYALVNDREMFGKRPGPQTAMDRLLNALHPDPEAVDSDYLSTLIEGDQKGRAGVPGLKTRARQIARIVRGGAEKKKGGRPPADHTPKDMAAARIVAAMHAAGHPDEEIHRALNDPDYSLSDMQRLRDLGPEAHEA